MARSPSGESPLPPKEKKRGYQRSLGATRSPEEKTGTLSPEHLAQLDTECQRFKVELRPEQCAALDRAVKSLSGYRSAPAVNDVKRLLKKAGTQARKLLDTLCELAAMRDDPTHAEAARRLGPKNALIAELWVLVHDARSEAATLPVRTLHRTGNAMLVSMIDWAMRRNWPADEPYPEALRPSVSGLFPGIVGICFDAAKYHFPKVALETYVTEWLAAGKDVTTGPHAGVPEDLRADVADAWLRELAFPTTSPKK